MVDRVVTVGDDFTLPEKVKVTDSNLPARLGATALNTALSGNVFKPSNYGTVDTSGAADSSTAVIGAITAAINAGGTVELPAGVIRVDSQIILPYLAGGVQKSLRITGQGRATNWQINSGTGGTTLDLRYSGGGHKIETYGQGVLELDHLTLADKGTSSTPFVLTIGTTLHAHDLGVSGNPSKSRATCDQDVFVLGGLEGTTTNNGPTHAFQGYGTVIERVMFEKIRSGVLARRFANNVVVSALSFSNRCGSNNDQGAIEFNPGTGAAVPGGEPAAFISGSVIRDNLIEVYGYKYGIRLMNKCEYNLISGNAFWDVDRGDYVADIMFDTAASNNTVLGTTVQTQGKSWLDNNGTNTFMGVWNEPGIGYVPMIRANNTGLRVIGGGGLKLQNNSNYSMKDSGGVDRALLTLSSGNILYIGDTAGAMSNQSVIVRCGATGSVIRLRAGSTDQVQVNATGVGFFGSSPAARPALTYSRATENAAQTQLRTALQSLGLVTDSTTA